MRVNDSEYVDTLIREATKKLAEALELCSLYEICLVEYWNTVQDAVSVIEDCKAKMEGGEFGYTDYLVCLKQGQQCKLELLLEIGAILDKDMNGESIVLNDDGVLEKI